MPTRREILNKQEDRNKEIYRILCLVADKLEIDLGYEEEECEEKSQGN